MAAARGSPRRLASKCRRLDRSRRRASELIRADRTPPTAGVPGRSARPRRRLPRTVPAPDRGGGRRSRLALSAGRHRSGARGRPPPVHAPLQVRALGRRPARPCPAPVHRTSSVRSRAGQDARARELPGWLSQADLNEYARAYAPTGFRGPLGVYRNQHRDWHEHPEIGTAGVRQPALLIGGRRDPAVLFGKLEPMEPAVPNLRRIVLLPNCGNWTQQERPGDINDELLDFLRREHRS